MGASASTSTAQSIPAAAQTADPAALTRRHHQTLSMVEKFVSTVYSSCPSVESMWLILTNKLGQKAFYQFVRAESTDEYFIVFRDLSEILCEKEISLENYISHFERVKDKVLDCEGELVGLISPFLRNELSSGPKNDEGKLECAHIKSLLERTQNELVTLMARDLFNPFIESKYYKNWRASESSHAAALSYEDASVSVTEVSSSAQSSTKSAPNTASIRFRSRMKSVVKPLNLATTAFASVDNRDLEAVLNMTDGWLSALITAVEALPVCFTLASASPDRRGFPLIYVNRYFEKVTGFDRTELIGKSCKDFLQCPQTEAASVEVLREALRTAMQAHTVLTNATYEKKLFKNLVAIKPIVDEKKQSKYIIGLHFDVSRDFDQGKGRVNLAKDLLASIPDSIFTDEIAFSQRSREPSAKSNKAS